MGPRYPGSEGHESIRTWLSTNLDNYGWEIETNKKTEQPEVYNIIGHQNSSLEYWIMIGTHYDTRQFSDEEADFSHQTIPVMGANDGASGTAVLMALARNDFDSLQCRLSIAFFDMEDQGRIDEQTWSYGAYHYVSSHKDLPDEVIIIDMIGDKDLEIFKENNSTDWLSDAIWKSAWEIGGEEYFLDQHKYSMIDDHLPFIQAGVPSALLIDFDYPYWHTNNDTIEHVSADSLEIIGNTLINYLENRPVCNPVDHEQ
ncbi:MAG: M28 family peptidase [Anaerolineaceae bacterium]|nr:M28 family peptidase [Anaerolineaceae bacterium]